MKIIYSLLFAGLLMIGCSKKEETITIAESRIVDENAELFMSAKSSAERFGNDFSANAHTNPNHDHSHGENPFDWIVPGGWSEKPATQMRLINLGFGENSDAECYVSVLQGAGGGLLANINRWRSQMLLPPLTAENIAELPKKKLLGQEAVYIKFSGDFKGMSDSKFKKDYMLVGLILEHKGISIFIKMVGPEKLLQNELDSFNIFSASLKLKDLPHNHDHAKPKSELKKSLQFSWQVPEHWIEQAEQKMRMATYQIGTHSNAECYVVVLPGDAGGVLPNINRWYKQMGHGSKAINSLDKVPEIDILNTKAKHVEILGNYTNMSGKSFNNFMMYGVIFSFNKSMIFIKMTGSESVIQNERQNFLTFCKSFEVL